MSIGLIIIDHSGNEILWDTIIQVLDNDLWNHPDTKNTLWTLSFGQWDYIVTEVYCYDVACYYVDVCSFIVLSVLVYDRLTSGPR